MMKDDFTDIIDALDSENEQESVDLLEDKKQPQSAEDTEKTVEPDVTADSASAKEVLETDFYNAPIDKQSDGDIEKTEQPLYQTEDDPEALTPADRVFAHYDMNNFSQQEAPNTSPQYQSVYRREPYIDGRPLQSKLVSDDAPAAGYTPSQRPQEQRRYDHRQGARARSGAKLGAGTIAVLLIVCILVSGLAGFGGSMLAGYLRDGAKDESDAMVIQKMEGDSSSGDSYAADKSTAQIASEVENSVVEITTEVMQTSSFYGQYIANGAGSGVIISEDGYILTNNHVIEGASSINVTLHTGESYQASVQGADDVVDIALLKIESEKELTPAVFGDSDKVKVGDKTVVIGNPLGTLGGSVTEGIISALDRSIVIDGQSMHLMQTDAAINPGNSGGGTFDGQGTLIGIVVAKSSNSSSGATIDNIGFVIPINNVLAILEDLKQYGYVRGRGDTGMTFVDLNNSMYSMYYYGNANPGVYISSVSSNSNASASGFRQGDRVISVNGTKVSSSSDIESIVSSLSAGDTVEFEIERGSQTAKITLTLDERTPESNTPDNSYNNYPQNPFGFGGF